MTQTMKADGRPLFFPASLATDDAGVIIAPAADSLAAVAHAVAIEELPLFTRRLLDAARKRRFQDRYRDVNRRRLELAALCIERWLEESLDAEFRRAEREQTASQMQARKEG